MLAIARGTRKDGSPILLKLREQDEQRYEQNRAEPVNPAGWSELHRSPVPVRNCVTAAPHCLNQTAVRGARAGSALQFPSEPNQVVNYVNVVKRICKAYAD